MLSHADVVDELLVLNFGQRAVGRWRLIQRRSKRMDSVFLRGVLTLAACER